jgi:4-oxalocrotonate tautomerase
MPIITISTYSGKTQQEKDRLAEAITEDVIKIFGVEKKDVIIVFQEQPMETGMQKVLDFNPHRKSLSECSFRS